MGSERIAFLALLLVACAPAVRPFAERPPLERDTDLDAIKAKCHREASKKDKDHVSCAPEVYVSPLAWDGIDNSIFRPFTRVFKVAPWGEAPNANSLDEVADSAWFTNRLGRTPMTVDDVVLGNCKPEQLLADSPPDGSWLVDEGKMNGSSLGFRVTIPGKGKYLMKVDGDPPERSTAASAIGAAVYRAAGFFSSCEQIVYFKPSALKLKPGLRVKDNTGVEKDFDQAALDRVVKAATPRGEQVRMQASAWLSGYLIGPYRYEGTRSDDPNDIIPHEDRRELRGMRVLASWLDHFDSREQNTMDTWMADKKDPPDSSPGHVEHHILDTSDCLGSEWAWDGISKRLGYSYLLDWGDIGAAFVTLGIPHHTWDLVERTPGHTKFGYFNVKDFRADGWKNEYPNPAFSRMTERDAAWMARKMAHITPAMVSGLAKAGEFTDPADTVFLEQTLEGRLEKILDRYLTKLSPLGEVHIDNGSLCATDLAELRAVRPPEAFHYEARIGNQSLTVEHRANAEVCVALPEDRALTIAMRDGVARGSLVAWVYHDGARYVLAGVERPEP